MSVVEEQREARAAVVREVPLDEALIHAWLELNMVIRENRFLNGLTLNEIAVFHYLLQAERERGEFLTLTELSQIMRLQKSQINGLLTKLVDRGFLVKKKKREDQRIQMIRVTPKGYQMYQTAHALTREVTRAVIDTVGEQRARSLVDSFTDIVDMARKNL